MRRPADQHPLLVLKVKVEAQVHQVLDACDRLDELVLAALCGFEPGLERRLLLGEGTHFLVEGRFGHDSSFILMFRTASFASGTVATANVGVDHVRLGMPERGRASGRERGCQYV